MDKRNKKLRPWDLVLRLTFLRGWCSPGHVNARGSGAICRLDFCGRRQLALEVRLEHVVADGASTMSGGVHQLHTT